MIIKAMNIFEDLFRQAQTRNGNYFCQMQGIDDEQSYNDFLALAHKKSKDPSEMVLLTALPLAAPDNRVLIQSILEQLPTMSIGYYQKEELILVADSALNQKLKEALDIVIPFAINKEHFTSTSIRDNFIVKMLLWANRYFNNYHLSRTEIPKAIFYGQPKKHEIYFMMLLAIAGLDVLQLSPQKEPLLARIDQEQLAQIIIINNAKTVKTLQERIANGVAVEKVTTQAKRATDELDEILYNGTGMFRPWQFADGNTHPVLINAAFEDIETYWNVQARLRTGFKVVGKTVYTPVFLTKILGVHRQRNVYFKLINDLRSAKLVYFAESLDFAPEMENRQAVYSLDFCLKPDKTIDRQALKKHELYKRMLTYRSDMQQFILNKLDELFINYEQGYFKFPITNKERIQLIAAVLNAPEALLNLIEAYDFTGDIPKAIFYLKDREILGKDDALLLGFLNLVGFDIVILSPNGANNIELVIEDAFINIIKLEEFVQNLPLVDEKRTEEKRSFLQRIFGD